MDFCQTSLHDCADSEPKKCDCSLIDDAPEDCSGRTAEQTVETNEPENSCGPSKCSSLETEISDVRAQLENIQATIDDMVKSEEQCYDTLAKDFLVLSREYEKTSNKIVDKQKENNDLQNTLRCKRDTEAQTVKDIEQLECTIAKIAECNKILENNNHKEQMIVNSLEEQLVCMEKSIARQKEQADGLRCEALAERDALCRKRAELQELRNRNAERCQVARELTAERREREAAVAALQESGPVALATATQAVDTARMALADACDAAADWAARRTHADEDCEQARADGDAQRCRGQATIRDMEAERDRLAERAAETVAQLTAAKNDRRLLSANVKANADRMACLRSETERCKQRVAHKRSVHAVQQANVEAETRSIEDRRAADNRMLAMADSELQVLRQASCRHEKAIEDARQELQQYCAATTSRR